MGNGATARDYQDFAHTGPGTLAGRFLWRFWQPIHRAEDLAPGHAKPVRIMSEDFTLYRGEGGTPHLVAFRCAHRGTQLSTGWVEGDCIRCFYHGWKYDGSGQCVEMPAEDPSFPPKVKIKSYPCQEYLGLIFAYLGEGQPPPLPRYPELDSQEGVLEVVTLVNPFNYFQRLENSCDLVHVAFVHRDSQFADSGFVGIPTIASYAETDFGLVMRHELPGGEVRVTHIGMPNVLLIKSPPRVPEEQAWREYVGWRVPIDDASHLSFSVALLHLEGEAARRYQASRGARLAARTAIVAELGDAVLAGRLRIEEVEDTANLIQVQDYVAVKGQGVIAARDQERLGRSDAVTILFRQLWARELRALAAGRALKQWRRPAALAVTSGV
ncbi:MAG TPA: Rieske 2Fe-2S domain-containing protein [Chloroflexota bacterium]|jgi:5,5'-dehydrodivanillate O-demethylase